MRERRLCVCARSRCDDDFTQNDERAEGELRGCFAKAARAEDFVLLWGRLLRFFPIRTREKREIFRKRAKKRDSLRAFLGQK